MNALRTHLEKKHKILDINTSLDVIDLIMKQEKRMYKFAEQSNAFVQNALRDVNLLWLSNVEMYNSPFVVVSINKAYQSRYTWKERVYSNGYKEQINMFNVVISIRGVIAYGLPSDVNTIEGLPTSCNKCGDEFSIEEIVMLQCSKCKNSINILN